MRDGCVDPRRQRFEHRHEAADGFVVAADHHAIAALASPDAAADADVDVVDLLLLQRARRPEIVDVVRVAAVDDRVARLRDLARGRRGRSRRFRPAPSARPSAASRAAATSSSSEPRGARVDTSGRRSLTSWPAARRRSVMFAPMRPRPTIPSCTRCPPNLMRATRRPRSFRVSQVAHRLGPDQPPEAERLAGNRQLVALVVHDLEEESGVRAALVELARRVHVPRPVAVRDDAARLLPQSAIDERIRRSLRRRVHERLHADVVALLRLGEELLDRALRLELRLLAGREHLVRLVLRRLHVGLVERVDLEVRAGDCDRELPAEELRAERVRIGQLGFRGLPVGARPATRPARGRDPCRACRSTRRSAARPRARSRPESAPMQILSRPSCQPSPNALPSS